MNIRDFLKKSTPVFFEGAMGSYYSAKYSESSENVEEENLKNPGRISDIHKEYLSSGCNALKTNTFSANLPGIKDEDKLKEIISAGYNIAKAAAGENDDIFVFADIGPISEDTKEKTAEEYVRVADIFLTAGAKYFLLETLSSYTGIEEVAAYIKGKCGESYIIVSFASQADGFTRSGKFVKDLLKNAADNKNIDAVGLNCVCGATHMYGLVQEIDFGGKPFSVMPNAGYPLVIKNRTVYDSDPGYFSGMMSKIASLGASFIGGCCGTTPEHLGDSIKKISGVKPGLKNTIPTKVAEKNSVEKNGFIKKLENGERPIAVEIDPPTNSDIDKFISGAREVVSSGADIITIADCPIARACMDPGILACKLKREYGIEALPHLTCRDRNLNAIKATLLGEYAEGVRNILTVTGDPLPSAMRDEVRSVYQFNSRKLAAYITSLGDNILGGHFNIFGALNVNAENFESELGKAKKKEDAGIIGFLTQPVLSERAKENLVRAREELGGFILGGIFPVVSERNAVYMNAEINGIFIDGDIIERYKGKSREEGEEIAGEICREIVKEISPYTDGFYLITPFNRTGLVSGIIKDIKNG